MKTFMSHQLLLMALLCIFSILATAYTISAYSVARYVVEWNGQTYWCYGPSGSFFPWPKEPGMLDVLTKMSKIDLFIYQHLIKTWLIIVVTLALWATTCTYIVKKLRILKHLSKWTKTGKLLSTIKTAHVIKCGWG